MIYLKILFAWISSFKSRFKKGFLLDIRESSHRQKDLVRNAKIIKETKRIEVSLKPLRIKIVRVRIYDKYNKIDVNNKNVKILMEDRADYSKINHAQN